MKITTILEEENQKRRQRIHKSKRQWPGAPLREYISVWIEEDIERLLSNDVTNKDVVDYYTIRTPMNSVVIGLGKLDGNTKRNR